MPTQVNTNYSAHFQKFVDFANKAYATKGENTVARFEGMPKSDYKGPFASFFRTSDMKTANDQVRDLFLKTVADMFGGERNIPELVVPFENLAANHMMNIANLKGAIDVALDGDFGADIVPFNGAFDADEIDAAEILDDILEIAGR